MADNVTQIIIEFDAKGRPVIKDAERAIAAMGSEANRSAGRLRSLTSRLQGLSTLVKTGAVAIGVMAAAGGTALIAITKSAANAGDEFQKMSLRTGVAVEQLSGLAHAAAISGTDIASVETGLRLLAQKMDDAQAGTKESVQAFEALGLTVTDTAGALKPVDTMLLELADKLQGLGDDTKAAALAQTLLGRSGTQLLPMLKSGADGINALTQEARTLGLTWSQDAADAAAEFNDALTRLTGTLTGTKNTIGQALLPAMTTLSQEATGVGQQITAWAQANQGLINTEVSAFAGHLISTLKTIAGMIGETIQAVNGFAMAIDDARATWSAGLSVLHSEAQRVLGLVTGLWMSARQAVAGAIDSIVAAIRGLTEEIESQLLGRLKSITDSVGSVVEKTAGFFRGLYDRVVGHSYVPELIDGIAAQFSRLPSVMVGPAESAAADAAKAFASMGVGDVGLPQLQAIAPDLSGAADSQATGAQPQVMADAEAAAQAQALWDTYNAQTLQGRIDSLTAQTEALRMAGFEESEIHRTMADDWMMLEQEKQMASGRFVGGVKAGWIEYAQSARSNSGIGKQAFEQSMGAMQTAFSSVLFQAIQKGTVDIGQIWKTLVTSMLQMFVSMVAQMIVRWLAFKALMAVGGGGFGGFLGGMFETGTPYVPETMPAVVHQGERILSVEHNERLSRALEDLGGAGGLRLDNERLVTRLETVADRRKEYEYITSIQTGEAATPADRGRQGAVIENLSVLQRTIDRESPIVANTEAPIVSPAIIQALKVLPAYDTGTPYVLRDMPAVVHQGERILSVEHNERLGRVMEDLSGAGGLRLDNERLVTRLETVADSQRSNVDLTLDRRGGAVIPADSGRQGAVIETLSVLQRTIDRESPNIAGAESSIVSPAIIQALRVLPAYDTGTPYVPQTMPAIVHRGERVLSAEHNERLIRAIESIRPAEQSNKEDSRPVQIVQITGGTYADEESMDRLAHRIFRVWKNEEARTWAS